MNWLSRGGAAPTLPAFQPLASSMTDPDFKEGFEHGACGMAPCPSGKPERWVTGFETGLRQLMSASPLLS